MFPYFGTILNGLKFGFLTVKMSGAVQLLTSFGSNNVYILSIRTVDAFQMWICFQECDTASFNHENQFNRFICKVVGEHNCQSRS